MSFDTVNLDPDLRADLAPRFTRAIEEISHVLSGVNLLHEFLKVRIRVFELVKLIEYIDRNARIGHPVRILLGPTPYLT